MRLEWLDEGCIVDLKNNRVMMRMGESSPPSTEGLSEAQITGIIATSKDAPHYSHVVRIVHSGETAVILDPDGKLLVMYDTVTGEQYPEITVRKTDGREERTG